MFLDIKDAYAKAADANRADGILPSGETLQNALASGIQRFTGIPSMPTWASAGMLASTWYPLTGRAIFDNPFRDFDIPVEESLIPVAQKASYDAVIAYGWTVK